MNKIYSDIPFFFCAYYVQLSKMSAEFRHLIPFKNLKVSGIFTAGIAKDLSY